MVAKESRGARENEYIIRRMLRRARGPMAAVVLAVLLSAACGAGGFLGKRYEYEEDVTIDLDGSATLTINASIPALVALRGLDLDISNSRVDRDKIRAAYQSPVTEVTRVSRPWRRSGRRFVQIRVKTTDIRKLGEVAPFAWSTYELVANGGEHTYKQVVGPSALKPGSLTNVGWTGSELVAFRLHLPSRILEHNSRDPDTDETNSVQRGNIVAWEQHLADRLEGKPVQIVVRLSSQSILYRTLWLFASAFGAAVLLLASLVWWTMKKGTREREVSRS
jgi:hypothetical protein